MNENQLEPLTQRQDQPRLWIANLDAEEHWRARSGRTLPRRVLERLALFGSLFRVLARDGDALWLPASIDENRLPELKGLAGRSAEPQILFGSPAEVLRRFPEHRLAPWAEAPPWIKGERADIAARVNDRRFGLALARRLGVADRRAVVLPNIEALRRHLDVQSLERWVVKAPFSASGRERYIHAGGTIEQAEVSVAKLLVRHGELVFEPWYERLLDVGVLFAIPSSPTPSCPTLSCPTLSCPTLSCPTPSRATVPRAHFQAIEPGGAVGGITLDAEVPEDLLKLSVRIAIELAEAGYSGPAGVDAWLHRENGQERWHLLGEINARWSLGHLARAVAQALPGWSESSRPHLQFGDQQGLEEIEKSGRPVQILLTPLTGSDGIWFSSG